MIGLTHRQRDCHLVIQDLMDAGIAPTLAAIAGEMDFNISCAHRLVNGLIERGYLSRENGPHSPLQILARLQPVPDFQFTITPQGKMAARP